LILKRSSAGISLAYALSSAASSSSPVEISAPARSWSTWVRSCASVAASVSASWKLAGPSLIWRPPNSIGVTAQAFQWSR
jgi:hypothetical protein